jgi:NADH-quinone oxidoreductase subunit J
VTLAQTAQVLAEAGDVSVAEQVVFWLLAPISLGGAIAMVAVRNAVHSALFLVATMVTLAVFYVLQAGPFIGMVQIIVYTGAIMMLFLFVLMLIGRDASDSLIETLRGQRMAAILIGVGFAGIVASALARGLGAVTAQGLEQANAPGNINSIASLLFTRYVFAFEVTSALLITAAVGAMLLAPLLPGMEQPPHPMRLGGSEKDYYVQALDNPGTSAGAERAPTSEAAGDGPDAAPVSGGAKP